MMEHNTYDKYWKERNSSQYYYNMPPAVLTVGGWYDGEDLYGALHTYHSIEEKNKGITNSIIMGPWIHGGWTRTKGDSLGDIYFGAETGDFYINKVELPFFNYHLKDNFPKPEIAEALMFETGSNKWRSYDKWPPVNTEHYELYFNLNSKLLTSNSENTGRESSYSEYVNNPDNPVPYTNFPVKATEGYYRPYMTEDQSFTNNRDDVLIFSTDVLEKDIVLCGPVEADLYISTSGTDCDIVVKVIDVWPNTSEGNTSSKMAGYQEMIRTEIMRGKFRNSYTTPQPFIEDSVYNVKIALQDINHCFKKGHKIMVQVQGSMFPLYDRNPNKFIKISEANDEDYIKTKTKLYHSGKHNSKMVFNKLLTDG